MSQRGSALIVGMMLLSLVMLLALSAAGAAHVELQLAHSGQFRENASSAANAGIETALSRIVSATDPTSVPEVFTGIAPGSSTDRFDVRVRFLGYELGVPQAAGDNLAAGHFEIVSTGHAPRGAIDVQRAWVRHVVPVAFAAFGQDCSPVAPEVRCRRAGDWERVAWQRVPRP